MQNHNHIVVAAEPNWVFLECDSENYNIRELPIIAWNVEISHYGSEIAAITPHGMKRNNCLGTAIVSPFRKVYSNKTHFMGPADWEKVLYAKINEERFGPAQTTQKNAPRILNFGERMAALKAKKATSVALNA